MFLVFEPLSCAACEKEGGFQEIFARSLVRMRSDQAKRIEVEKDLRDMQLKVMMFV